MRWDMSTATMNGGLFDVPHKWQVEYFFVNNRGSWYDI